MKSLWVTKQTVNMEIPTETCTHDLKKMFIYSIIKKGENVYNKIN